MSCRVTECAQHIHHSATGFRREAWAEETLERAHGDSLDIADAPCRVLGECAAERALQSSCGGRDWQLLPLGARHRSCTSRRRRRRVSGTHALVAARPFGLDSHPGTCMPGHARPCPTSVRSQCPYKGVVHIRFVHASHHHRHARARHRGRGASADARLTRLVVDGVQLGLGLAILGLKLERGAQVLGCPIQVAHLVASFSAPEQCLHVRVLQHKGGGAVLLCLLPLAQLEQRQRAVGVRCC
mmetsp:Transcript_25291/g.68479  ORF Transcript_25291/g.68479 Transcript_25291/m.68479 type:complete len:242 (-) Transcript_25291:671-1396(-)